MLADGEHAIYGQVFPTKTERGGNALVDGDTALVSQAYADVIGVRLVHVQGGDLHLGR